MAQRSVYQEILDYANRANPYPLYARLRQTPLTREEDGTYVVSTYREIVALLHDPRLSSDPRKVNKPEDLSFIGRDPPDHGRLRRLAMRHFGPPHTPERVDGMRGGMASKATRLIDNLRGRTQIDIVNDFAYPFPVGVVCNLLGVPPDDEPRFRVWAEAIVSAADGVVLAGNDEAQRQGARATTEARQYMAELAEAHRRQPGDDMLSGLVSDDGPEGRMSLTDIVDTAILLLIAGHETTVNLIANGMLTLLRHPDVLDRLRREPELIISLVEELLRYEPPAQFNPALRIAQADIPIADITIPNGATVTLALAAGNRDPQRFADPERFIPDRPDNQHLGFGHGIHACFGAPMARLEAQLALTALVRRLDNPRLVADPPPYRQSPILRGPRHLLVEVDGVKD
jgi:cytochrome P450